MFVQAAVTMLLILMGASCMGSDATSELIDAAAAGDTRLVQRVINSGTDPDSRANDDWTALTVSAREGHVAVVKVLLDSGADPNRAEGGGNTPLFWAAWGGHPEVAKLLLDRGADLEKKCRDCDSPIEIAEKRSNGEVVTLIQRHQKILGR